MTKTAENTYEIIPTGAGTVKVVFKARGTAEVGNGATADEENEKSGCGSSVAGVAFMLPFAVSAYILRKKKED